MNICAASSHGQVDLELLGIKKIPRNKIMEQNLRKEESFTSMVEAIEGKCFAERFVWPCHIYRVFTGKEFEGLADLIEALELGDKCDADKVSDDFDFADLHYKNRKMKFCLSMSLLAEFGLVSCSRNF